MERLIPKSMIPITLWDGELMYLPPQLVSKWEALLIENGLFERAKQRSPEGFTGGRSKEDTDNHFAWRFTGSSARVMLAMLDPNEELQQSSDAIAKMFSGNKVFLVDLPMGAGAASVAILSVLCELRKQKLIPRMPLEISIIGGDISPYAQEYAKAALQRLIPDLEEQAISIDYTVVHWDVCDSFSNTDLIKCLTIKSQNCATKLLLMTNFNDFLEKDKKWKEAEPQLNELFRYSRDKNSVAVWLEPQLNVVVLSFIPRLITWFKALFAKILPQEANQENSMQSSIKVKHPLVDGHFHNRLVVVRFDLPEGPSR